MKSFKEFIIEKDVDKTILDMWRDSADIGDIVRTTKKKKGYIKDLLKTNNRKGWEEL